MKAESNVKPQLVERYPGLVRINYDVQEEQREDMNGTKSTVYVYRMLELPSVNMSVDELTATLKADKYDKATQIQMASDDDKKITLALFTANCTIYAKKILGMEPSLSDVKAQKLAEISVYDASDAVNSFTIDGKNIWLSKDTRLALRQRFIAEQASGIKNTSLWYGAEQFNLSVSDALPMLNSIEIYACKCYDITAAHKANVHSMTDIEDILSYDFRVGYPDKLSFTTTEE